ncbi:MAG: phosphopyruvate hydratase [Candidatus Diapherotrites archaeon]|nr:phosphopyruvate hydratase [Candidatus Diapherotrites archaeon]
MIGKYEITDIKARQILDSRGNPTVECWVKTGKGTGIASVPSGASTGKHEAVELRDGEKEYNGLGVTKAVKNISRIEAKLMGHDARDQDGIDRIMMEMDGTPNKSHLGANATLAVSMAVCRAAASSKEGEVYDHIGIIYGARNFVLPVPFFNVINGGQHAGNALDIQEFMIAPIGAESFSEALRIGSEVHHSLKGILHSKYGVNAVNVGDEGGFAPPMKKSKEALDALVAAVKKSGHYKKVGICMDAAATSFQKGKKYKLDGKVMDAEGLTEYYESLAAKYPIIAIEDPFGEDDYDAFAMLTERIGENVQITGDDIFVTNNERLKDGIMCRAGNALLLKLNQIGTIIEAFDAAHLARHAGYSIMVSHRSGETCDPFIADLAVGIGCGQIKAGAPCRGERLAKYNQLLRIEEHDLPYAGMDWRKKGVE